MAIGKTGAGNPASLATVMDVWLASMGEVSVVLTDPAGATAVPDLAGAGVVPC